MFRVILSIVLLVVLVVLIVLNLGFTTSFNLFGWKFEEIPVTAVALVSFAIGVLYSFAYYLGRYFSKISKAKFRKRGEQVKTREQELKEEARVLVEKAVEKSDDIEEAKRQPQTGAGGPEGGKTSRRKKGK